MNHSTEGVSERVPESQTGGIGTARKRTGTDWLTDRDCKNAKPDPHRGYPLADGRGMRLWVQPNGSKLWQLPFELAGKESIYSIGPYPEVSLVKARAEREKARAWLREGKNPVHQRKLERALAGRTDRQFESIAREFFDLQDWSENHRAAVIRRFEQDLAPDLGHLPIDAIGADLALATIKKIEKRGALETASKCRVLSSQICRHAIVTGRLQVDPFAHLGTAMQARKPVNRATIPLDEMPALFQSLAKVPAELNTRLALYWLMLTCTRTTETRFAVWAEIEPEKSLWRIPEERMKMREGHVVPLSTPALRVLELARPLRRSDDADALIFPGFTKAGSLSENALLALLARAGYYGRQTSHGFRASFSTWAHEVQEANPDIIESVLAHRSRRRQSDVQPRSVHITAARVTAGLGGPA